MLTDLLNEIEPDEDDFDSVMQIREDEITDAVYNAMTEICPDEDIDDEMVLRATNLFCRFLAEGLGLIVYRPSRIQQPDGSFKEVDYPYNE